MPRTLLLTIATVVALAGAGVGGAALAGAFDGDDTRVLAVTVGERAQPGLAPARLTVEDGIARDRALALAEAATRRVPGQALSVEPDDGDFEVAVRDRAGRVSDVLLDARARVIRVDAED